MENTVNKITHKDLMDALHKADVLLRPYVVFVNPNDKDYMLSELKQQKFDKYVLLETSDMVKQGTAIKINREELENWGKIWRNTPLED